MIKCEGGQLYTGIAADIVRRMREHASRSEKCAKYTRSHKIVSLEALWTAETRSLASKLEYRIKQLTKEKKLKLIERPDSVSEICGLEENFKPADKPSLDSLLH